MRTANVLVIGIGGAGLRAAIAAQESGAEVVVIGRRGHLDAHTVLASGGINAALGTLDAEDSWQQHFADTVREGYFLAATLGSSRSSPGRPRRRSRSSPPGAARSPAPAAAGSTSGPSAPTGGAAPATPGTTPAG